MFSFQNSEKSEKMDEPEEFWRQQVVLTNINTKIKTSFWGGESMFTSKKKLVR